MNKPMILLSLLNVANLRIAKLQHSHPMQSKHRTNIWPLAQTTTTNQEGKQFFMDKVSIHICTNHTSYAH
uniref:Secreted protein n=1 Tax=Rhizophora mucronata TaxID=61149 RepID=A0A2P2PU47_RHIMU